MKTISIFDVQDINKTLQENNYDYVLKLRDACGNQSLLLETAGEKVDAAILCEVINTVLQAKHLKVKPGSINPYQIIVY